VCTVLKGWGGARDTPASSACVSISNKILGISYLSAPGSWYACHTQGWSLLLKALCASATAEQLFQPSPTLLLHQSVEVVQPQHMRRTVVFASWRHCYANGQSTITAKSSGSPKGKQCGLGWCNCHCSQRGPLSGRRTAHKYHRMPLSRLKCSGSGTQHHRKGMPLPNSDLPTLLCPPSDTAPETASLPERRYSIRFILFTY
jgi:hypothetical protein